jgi:hypothetical protein
MTDMTLPKVEDKKEEVTAVSTPPIKKMHILIIYAESDRKHFQGLDQHLQLMYGRLGNQTRHYFAYRAIEEPKPYTGDSQYFKEQYEKEKAAYEEDLKNYTGHHNTMIRYLKQEQLLLILYVSNSLMEYLKTDQTPELRTLLNNPNHRIAPVLITPTAGFARNCEPLCAFSGVAFETACQHIATTIEAIARDYFGETLVLPDTTPFALLASPSAIHVSLPSEQDRIAQMFAGLQAVFEQTHARIIESQQQLVIAERSQREARGESEAELRRQMEEMKQQITTLQTWQNESLATKLRRLFRIPPAN